MTDHPVFAEDDRLRCHCAEHGHTWEHGTLVERDGQWIRDAQCAVCGEQWTGDDA